MTRILVFAAIFGFVIGAAHAVDQEEALRRACATDALTYCAHTIPLGRPAIAACMTANAAKLSTECKDAIRQAKKDRK